jgi:hypothetical protein
MGNLKCESAGKRKKTQILPVNDQKLIALSKKYVGWLYFPTSKFSKFCSYWFIYGESGYSKVKIFSLSHAFLEENFIAHLFSSCYFSFYEFNRPLTTFGKKKKKKRNSLTPNSE